MDDSNFHARELADMSDVPPRTRRRVTAALLAFVAGMAAVSINFYLREAATLRLEASIDWRPPAVDYQ